MWQNRWLNVCCRAGLLVAIRLGPARAGLLRPPEQESGRKKLLTGFH